MSVNKSLQSDLKRLEKYDLIVAFSIFTFVLTLYVRTLAPDLLLGDSGEFQTLIYSMGMTHPTGYPIFILFGRIFTFLPLGELAWRANLYVAVQGALTAATIYAIVRILVGWTLPSVFAALALAVMPFFWFHAIIAELYIPACLFSALVVLCLLCWKQSSNHRYLWLAGLVGGLSLGVHSTVALIAPAVLVYLFITRASKTAWKQAVLGALIGLTLFIGSYALLDGLNQQVGYYHASIEHALSTWNMNANDFNSFPARFRFMYFGKQFQDLMFANPQHVMASNAAGLVEIVKTGFLPGSLVLAALGFILLFISQWKENIFFSLAALTQILFALNYEVYDYYVFFIPSFIFLAIWMGSAVGILMNGIQKVLSGKSLLHRHREKLSNTFSALIIVSLCIMWFPVLSDAWAAKSVSFAIGTRLDEYPYPINNPDRPHQQALALVNALEEDAMVFTDWDMLFPYYFVASLELQNQQLDFFETYPQDESDGLSGSTYTFIVENLDRPIYFTDRPHGRFAAKLNVIPVKRGLFTLYQVQGVKE